MVWGLVGDDCKKESAEKCEAEAGGQHDVARRKGGFEFGFVFVGHGFGVGGWKKRMCVGEAHPSVGLGGHAMFVKDIFCKNLNNSVIHFLTILVNKQSHKINDRVVCESNLAHYCVNIFNADS